MRGPASPNFKSVLSDLFKKSNFSVDEIKDKREKPKLYCEECLHETQTVLVQDDMFYCAVCDLQKKNKKKFMF